MSDDTTTAIEVGSGANSVDMLTRARLVALGFPGVANMRGDELHEGYSAVANYNALRVQNLRPLGAELTKNTPATQPTGEITLTASTTPAATPTTFVVDIAGKITMPDGSEEASVKVDKADVTNLAAGWTSTDNGDGTGPITTITFTNGGTWGPSKTPGQIKITATVSGATVTVTDFEQTLTVPGGTMSQDNFLIAYAGADDVRPERAALQLSVTEESRVPATWTAPLLATLKTKYCTVFKADIRKVYGFTPPPTAWKDLDGMGPISTVSHVAPVPALTADLKLIVASDDVRAVFGGEVSGTPPGTLPASAAYYHIPLGLTVTKTLRDVAVAITLVSATHNVLTVTVAGTINGGTATLSNLSVDPGTGWTAQESNGQVVVTNTGTWKAGAAPPQFNVSGTATDAQGAATFTNASAAIPPEVKTQSNAEFFAANIQNQTANVNGVAFSVAIDTALSWTNVIAANAPISNFSGVKYSIPMKTQTVDGTTAAGYAFTTGYTTLPSLEVIDAALSLVGSLKKVVPSPAPTAAVPSAAGDVVLGIYGGSTALTASPTAADLLLTANNYYHVNLNMSMNLQDDSAHITLDGANDFVSLSQLPTDGSMHALQWDKSWAIGCMLRNASETVDTQRMCLFSRGDAAITFMRGGSNMGLYLRMATGGYTGANTWVAVTGAKRVLFVYDATTYKLKYYLDGQLKATVTLIQSVRDTSASDTDPLLVGSAVPGAIHWDGDVDNVVISSGTELTGGNIEEYFSSTDVRSHSYYSSSGITHIDMGEDAHPTVSDSVTGQIVGQAVNTTPEDFAEHTPAAPATPSGFNLSGTNDEYSWASLSGYWQFRGLIERVGNSFVASSDYGLFQLNINNHTWTLYWSQNNWNLGSYGNGGLPIDHDFLSNPGHTGGSMGTRPTVTQTVDGIKYPGDILGGTLTIGPAPG